MSSLVAGGLLGLITQHAKDEKKAGDGIDNVDTLSELSTDVPSSQSSSGDASQLSAASSSNPSDRKIARVVEQLRALKLRPSPPTPESKQPVQDNEGLEMKDEPQPASEAKVVQVIKKTQNEKKQATHDLLPPFVRWLQDRILMC